MTKKLLRNIINGQEDTLEQVINSYYKDIYTFCYYRLNDKNLAQDLTQDVFLKFLQNIDSYCHQDKIKNYLYVIARNTIKDYFRKKKDLSLKNSELSPGVDKIEELHERIAIQMALKQLTDVQRDIIIFRYYQNLKFSEIANILSMAQSTVRYQLKQAEKTLKLELR